MRVGLGCMRLSTGDDLDEGAAVAAIAAAVDAGITVFDTARAYGRDGSDLGHNEALLACGLHRCGATAGVRIVTKGGMTRDGHGWVPDGRAKTIRADCEASLGVLDGLPIDLYLIHAPDPRTPWRTTVRALARLADEGLVQRVGVSNVSRSQLDEAVALAPIAAIEVALNVFDDRVLRGGLIGRCEELGISVIAHSPFGGPRRAGALARHPLLAEVASRSGAMPAEVALAWLLGVSDNVIAIPGARRAETVRSAARAARLALAASDHDALAEAFGRVRRDRFERPRARPTAQGDADIVVAMGIPGAGKSQAAEDLVARGYLRLNRDERGGSLRDVASELDRALASGIGRIVLDNTYLTRAARSHVLDVGRRHDVAVRCVWIDIPLAQAQVNIVTRLLDRFGCLPSPDELRSLARREPGLLAPTSQMRAHREFEPPARDEGFASIAHVPFERAVRDRPGRAGVLVAAGALERSGWDRIIGHHEPDTPHLIFDWRPGGTQADLGAAAARIATLVTGAVAAAVCPHQGGPPICWCRPPLPGLPLAFARAHEVDLATSLVIGTSAAHRTLAATLGAVYTPL